MKQALALAFLVFPGAALAATGVASDSNCPSSEMVSLKLVGLLPEGGPGKATVRIHSDGGALQIELATSGEEPHRRAVPVTGDCEARAEMAALVIASWLDAMPVGTIRAPGIPPRQVRFRQTQGVEQDGSDDGETEPLAFSMRTYLGASILGLVDGQGAGTGLAMAASMPNLLDEFGLWLDLSLALPRNIAVGQGTAQYWRPTLALAASAEFYRKNLVLRVQAGPALGVLLVHGSGYNPDRSDSSLTWGAQAGLSLVQPWRRDEVWLLLEALLWTQGRAVHSPTPSGVDLTARLPESELRLSLGFSWEIR
jgi:hypothetical protein